MIYFDCRVLHKILSAMRRTLGLRKNSSQLVLFATDHKSTTVCIDTAEACLACQLLQPGLRSSAAIAMHAFADMPVSGRQGVRIYHCGNNVEVQFGDFSYPRPVISQAACSVVAVHDIRSRTLSPQVLLCNPSRLGVVLQQAAGIADPTSTRFSLGTLRLRGHDGQVAATDGRQALTVDGFNLPPGELLIPASILAKHPSLAKCSGLSIGCSTRTGSAGGKPLAAKPKQDCQAADTAVVDTTSQWLSLRFAVGMHRWMIDIKALEHGRFPNVDQCIPSLASSRSVIHIADSDAGYLLKRLPWLMGKSQEITPLTIDLSLDRQLGKRQVQLRFRREFAAIQADFPGQHIELTLKASSYVSQPMRVVTTAEHLLNALRFGHRQIHLPGPGLPVFCHDATNHYVFTAMHDSLALGPSPRMQAISTAYALAAG